MTKRFTVIIIAVNIVMGSILFISNQSIIAFLASHSGPPNPLIVRDFNILTILTAPYNPPGSEPIPTIAATTPYFPFYVFIFILMLNAIFIIKVLRTKDK
jgi:hypothetical protein